MRTLSAAPVLFSMLIAAGCATLGSAPAALEKSAGKFVTYTCEGNKSFQLRWNPDTRTIRYRGHEGGLELSRASDGSYKDDSGELALTLGDGKSTTVSKKGKVEYKGCGAA